MKEVKLPKNINITKKLWKSMSDDQKTKFVESYKRYLWELNELSKIHDRIAAHNLAFLAATSN